MPRLSVMLRSRARLGLVCVLVYRQRPENGGSVVIFVHFCSNLKYLGAPRLVSGTFLAVSVHRRQ